MTDGWRKKIYKSPLITLVPLFTRRQSDEASPFGCRHSGCLYFPRGSIQAPWSPNRSACKAGGGGGAKRSERSCGRRRASTSSSALEGGGALDRLEERLDLHRAASHARLKQHVLQVGSVAALLVLFDCKSAIYRVSNIYIGPCKGLWSFHESLNKRLNIDNSVWLRRTHVFWYYIKVTFWWLFAVEMYNIYILSNWISFIERFLRISATSPCTCTAFKSWTRTAPRRARPWLSWRICSCAAFAAGREGWPTWAT